MNTRHIEQTHSEEFTSELFDIAYTDRAGDLVTSSLSKPYAEASGTEEVKGDFTSYITELPATLKVFVRRLFSAPAKVFGGKSMSQMFGGVKEAYDWLKERVKGSDGIPKKELPAVEDAAHLAENLRVLEGRDIVSGLTLTKTETGEDGTENVQSFPCPEGLSLVRLLCGSDDYTAQVTEVIDSNQGYTLKTGLSKIKSQFPSVDRVSLGCSKMAEGLTLANGLNIHEIELPNLEELRGNYSYAYFLCNVPIKRLHLPKLKKLESTSTHSSFASGWIYNMPYLEEVIIGDETDGMTVDFYLAQHHNCFLQGNYDSDMLPMLKTVMINAKIFNMGRGTWMPFIAAAYHLEKLILGTIIQQTGPQCLGSCPNLIHLEVGDGTCCSLIFTKSWSPGMALRTDTDAEDYVDLRESTTFANNLEQFLYNFQTYIADRVADRTGQSALTLTLSSAVYAALEAQEGQTILATLTSKNWTVASA